MSMPVAMPGSRAAHVFVGLAEEFAWSAVYGDFGHPGSIPLPAPGPKRSTRISLGPTSHGTSWRIQHGNPQSEVVKASVEPPRTACSERFPHPVTIFGVFWLPPYL